MSNAIEFGVFWGFIVTFLLILLDKYEVPKRLIEYTKYRDVCYFCWCFWVSAIGCILFDSIEAMPMSTVLSRFLHTVITKK